MENNKWVVGLVCAAVIMLGAVSIVKKPVSVNVFNPLQTSGEAKLGTGMTINTSNGKYTESADLYQNIQAMSERMTALSQYQVLQADSSGSMQAVAPTALAGAWTFGSDTRAASFIQTGTIADITVTTTITAAQICDSTLIRGTATTGTPTYTLPPTSTLFADCLTTNGDMKMLGYVNGSATTGTVFAAGTGGTLLYSSSLTVAAAKGAFLRIIRDSATTYTAVLINAAN
jgi:hypothetical protein